MLLFSISHVFFHINTFKWLRVHMKKSCVEKCFGVTFLTKFNFSKILRFGKLLRDFAYMIFSVWWRFGRRRFVRFRFGLLGTFRPIGRSVPKCRAQIGRNVLTDAIVLIELLTDVSAYRPKRPKVIFFGTNLPKMGRVLTLTETGLNPNRNGS